MKRLAQLLAILGAVLYGACGPVFYREWTPTPATCAQSFDLTTAVGAYRDFECQIAAEHAYKADAVDSMLAANERSERD